MSNFKRFLQLVFTAAFICMTGVSELTAMEHRGQVRFGEVPVPSASVQATQLDKTFRVMTDAEGRYVFPDLSDGTWTVQVEMPGFEGARKEVVIAKDTAAAQWDLKMLPLDGIKGEPSAGFPKTSTLAPLLQTSAPEPDAANRLLINGSVVNGAATPFGLQRAFGTVRQPRSPYRGTVSFSGSNALFDARSFSLTGQNTPRADYNRMQSSISINGPLQIPHLFRMGQFTVSYNRTQNRNASVQTTQMPTFAERLGDFSSSSTAPMDPTTGELFPSGVIPQSRISPQARALAGLYPLPNFNGGGRYNYQVPVVGVTHGDNIQGSITNIRVGRANQLSGSGGFST